MKHEPTQSSFIYLLPLWTVHIKHYALVPKPRVGQFWFEYGSKGTFGTGLCPVQLWVLMLAPDPFDSRFEAFSNLKLPNQKQLACHFSLLCNKNARLELVNHLWFLDLFWMTKVRPNTRPCIHTLTYSIEKKTIQFRNLVGYLVNNTPIDQRRAVLRQDPRLM